MISTGPTSGVPQGEGTGEQGGDSVDGMRNGNGFNVESSSESESSSSSESFELGFSFPSSLEIPDSKISVFKVFVVDVVAGVGATADFTFEEAMVDVLKASNVAPSGIDTSIVIHCE